MGSLSLKHEAEIKYKAILESTVDSIISINQKGIIEFVNQATERIFGYSKEELIGRNISVLMPSPYDEEHDQYMKNYLKNGKKKIIGIGQEVQGKRKDGTILPIYLAVSEVKLKDKTTFIGIIRDITMIKLAEQVLLGQNIELENVIEERTLELKKRTEDYLKFYQAIEQSPTIIMITDTKGNIEYVNTTFTEISGYTLKEVIGKNPRFLKSSFTSQSEYKQMWDTITNGGNWISLMKNKKKNGDNFWVNTNTFAIKNSEGIISNYISIQEDITSRKKVEKELKESEGRLRSIIDSAVDVIWEIGLQGNINYVSPQVNAIYGYKQEEVIGKPITHFLMKEEIKRALDFFPDLVSNPRSIYNYEFTLPHKEGYELIVELNAVPITNEKGKLIAYRGINRDVTQRKLVDKKLKESEERYRVLFENASEAILIHDTVKNRYVDANTNALNLFKIKPEKLSEIDPVDLAAHIQPNGASTEKLIEELQITRKTTYLEWMSKDLEGRIFPTEIRLIQLPSPERNLVRISVIDVTERKKIEEELKKSQEQFAQAQKMEAIGRLAGGIAHDFNNMLTAILGYTSLIENKLPNESNLKEYVEEIRKASISSASLTNQLLIFSRHHVVEQKVINLNDIIHNFIKILIRVLGEDIDFNQDLANDLANIKADPNQIEHVIMNLSVNARDAMPNGGELWVKTSNILYPDLLIDNEINKELPSVMLEIRDTGIGMDEDTLKCVFEPFFTTKEKGTGLGLTNVYGIVEQNDGQISISSEVGKGTSIRIFFPQTFDLISEEVNDIIIETSQKSEKKTILVVEDENSVRNMLTIILVENGYDVKSTSSPEKGIKIFKDNTNYDLVISDMIMPNMNGLEFMKQVTDIKPNINALFITGYVDIPIYKELRKKGYLILEKPFTPNEFLKIVEDVIQ